MINLESPSRIAEEKLILEAKLGALIATSSSLSTIELREGGGGVNSRIMGRWFAH